MTTSESGPPRSTRLPFRPRDVNANARSSSQTASLVSSKGSGSKASMAVSSMASRYLNSYLESSNNPNNVGGHLPPGTNLNLPVVDDGGEDSTRVNAGGKIPPTASSDERGPRSQSASSSEPQRQQPPQSRQQAEPAAPNLRRSSSSRQKPTVIPEDQDEVEITEHRRKPNGEGYTIHRYIRGRLLGKGGFAKVYWCTSLDTNRHYAVKIVPKANLVRTRQRQKLQAEIKIHRSLKHRYVCEYKHFFEDKENCYILLELCQNQSLNEMIKRRKCLTEPESKFYLKQLFESVQYMHKANVIHRDLKLGNIFLDKNLNVKVGDFGLATRLSTSEEKRKTICGTPNYIAPEVIDGNKETRGHSFEVDIWSMGVIMFTTLVGKPPYESKDVKSTYQRILANKYEFPDSIPITNNAKDLISAMLQTNPQKRPSLDAIAAHPFFTHEATKMPKSIPLSCTHVAPDWREDAKGVLYAKEKESDAKYCRPTVSSRISSSGKRLAISDGSSRAAHASAPLATRNVNAGVSGARQASKAGGTASAASGRTPSSQFNIFNDAGATSSSERKVNLGKLPQSSSAASGPNPTTDPIDEITRKVEACAVFEDKGLNFDHPEMQASDRAPASDRDAYALEVMHGRLRDAFQAAEMGNPYRIEPAETVSTEGTLKWVTRYVDYTSKYGLGFLLNDGSAGVYFNDSTKAVLAPEDETFMYVERSRVAEVNRNAYEMHTLSSYPEMLQKKVTLLKHFRNYLVEQQKKAQEEGEEGDAVDVAPPAVEVVDSQTDYPLPYLKKWVRTKHAILFRLSNGTVQVVFYDHTEVLLSDDAKVVTYVDKRRNRTTYRLDEIMMESSAEIGKRLKYAKDILKQLIPGQKS